jgi:RNA recognition motif-containing protein
MKGVFEPFGAIKEIVIKTKQGSTNSYCFVEYQTLEAAIKAEAGYF